MSNIKCINLKLTLNLSSICIVISSPMTAQKILLRDIIGSGSLLIIMIVSKTFFNWKNPYLQRMIVEWPLNHGYILFCLNKTKYIMHSIGVNFSLSAATEFPSFPTMGYAAVTSRWRYIQNGAAHRWSKQTKHTLQILLCKQ